MNKSLRSVWLSFNENQTWFWRKRVDSSLNREGWRLSHPNRLHRTLAHIDSHRHLLFSRWKLCFWRKIWIKKRTIYGGHTGHVLLPFVKRNTETEMSSIRTPTQETITRLWADEVPKSVVAVGISVETDRDRCILSICSDLGGAKDDSKMDNLCSEMEL